MNAFKLKIAVALATLVAGAGARADNAVETSSLSVEFTRAELSSEQGAQALYARMGTAARAVCGARSAVVAELVQWQRCRAEALDRAVAEVNDARLSSVHIGTTPRRLLAQAATERSGNAGS